MNELAYNPPWPGWGSGVPMNQKAPIKLNTVTSYDVVKEDRLPPGSMKDYFREDEDIVYIKIVDDLGKVTIRGFHMTEFDMNLITAGTAQSVAATNQTFHDTLGTITDKYSELAGDIAGLALGQQQLMAKQNECCCGILRAIDGVNYNHALNTAGINANVTAMGQKILDAFTGSRMADMQNRINQLELAQAMAGVVRYPNGWMYNAGTAPFCGSSSTGSTT